MFNIFNIEKKPLIYAVGDGSCMSSLVHQIPIEVGPLGLSMAMGGSPSHHPCLDWELPVHKKHPWRADRSPHDELETPTSSCRLRSQRPPFQSRDNHRRCLDSTGRKAPSCEDWQWPNQVMFGQIYEAFLKQGYPQIMHFLDGFSLITTHVGISPSMETPIQIERVNRTLTNINLY